MCIMGIEKKRKQSMILCIEGNFKRRIINKVERKIMYETREKET